MESKNGTIMIIIRLLREQSWRSPIAAMVAKSAMTKHKSSRAINVIPPQMLDEIYHLPSEECGRIVLQSSDRELQ